MDSLKVLGWAVVVALLVAALLMCLAALVGIMAGIALVTAQHVIESLS